MSEKHPFIEQLERHAAVMNWGMDRLAAAADLPKSTIASWRRRNGPPREWQSVVKVAQALGLNMEQTDAMLSAAGQPPLRRLVVMAKAEADEYLLARYTDAAESLANVVVDVAQHEPSPHSPEMEVVAIADVAMRRTRLNTQWIWGVVAVTLVIGGAWTWQQFRSQTDCLGTEPGMCEVAAGPFLRGSTEQDLVTLAELCTQFDAGCEADFFRDELPQASVTLDGFYIDRFEVTNRDFQRFVDADGYVTTAENVGFSMIWDAVERTSTQIDGANWRNPGGPGTTVADIMDHPVVHVSWQDANQYCRWAEKRLPTEAEWEKAARGEHGFLFPWGNEWDSDAGAYVDDATRPLAKVGSYPQGASPYGVEDMLGNVSEWVNDWYDDTYYERSESLLNPQGPATPANPIRVRRGGGRATRAGFLHTAWRIAWPAPVDTTNDLLGFRCAKDF